VSLYEVLRRPLITEKNTTHQAVGKYVFEVRKDSNKVQVKQAVEKAFNVTVTAVNVVTVPGEMRRIGKRKVVSQSWKKAIVTLKSGDKIELVEGV
jgi:large subunit ribosomal protein L23